MTKSEGYIRVLRIIIPYIFIFGFFQLVGYLIAGVDVIGGEKAITTVDYSIIMFFAMLGTLLVIWLFNKKVDGEQTAHLGFKMKGHSKDFVNGLVITGSIIIIGFFILLVFEELTILSWRVDFQHLALSILLFIFVSVGEEVLMRGYVLNNLMISLSPKLALLVSSLLFGLMHFANPSFSLLPFVNLVLAGIFLGVPFIFNRNLWFPIAGHFAWNFLQGSILGFNVSGKKLDSLLEIDVLSANIWNGGEFGFEGSILCTFLLIIGILFIYHIYKRKYS